MYSGKSSSRGFLENRNEQSKQPEITNQKEVATPAFDLDKLAHAVAFAETSSCTKGTAIKKKNCFGIMRFWIEKGVRKRTAKTYKSHEEGFADFKRIWSKSYGGFPTMAMAEKWTGKDNARRWLNNVTKYYNSH